MKLHASLWAGLTLAGCAPAGRPAENDPAAAHIEITPPDAVVTVTDNVAVLQSYTATLVDADGDRSDVTSSVVFTLDKPGFGQWTGATLTVTGEGAGPTRVVATEGEVRGDTSLTVFVKGRRNDGSVPPNAGDLFDGATEMAARAPALAYPADGILVPPNLGAFDVHWQPGTDNSLFEVSLHNDYVDLRIYKLAAGPAFTSYTPAEWQTLASPSEQLTLTVAGMNPATPTVKGTSPAQHVAVTKQIVQGGLYYWTTTAPQGIFRYDMGTPDVPPSSFFPTGSAPGGTGTCVGCHTLSRDGTKIAMTLDGGNGRGAVFNVADRSILVPFEPNSQRWNFATFNANATKLVTVLDGDMVLRDCNGGAVIGSPLINTDGTVATHPELSPDGTQLASVEAIYGGYDYAAATGSIVVRSFDNTTNHFGPTRTLVADAPDASNFYPSWSPDGQWLLFTRTKGNSNNNPRAEVWVIKSDGSQPPIRLGAANATIGTTNSWARWTPFQQTFGSTDEPVFYITFSSARAFGVRPLISGQDGVDKQIWMAPFFPDRAAANMDPSGPAFRMPFQDLATSNHIAQWTQAVVIGRKPDGSALTQLEAVTATKR